jgi:predicted lipoprotein
MKRISMMRTIVSMMTAVVVVATCATPAAAELCGDADGSGSITVTDGVRVLRSAAGLGDCELALCDVDGGGTVTVTDGVNVLRAAAGLGTPAGCSGGGNGGLGPRRTFLRDLANTGAIPSYRVLASDAADLQIAVEDLVTAPGAERLAIAQQAWRETRRAWKETEAFRLGPSEAQRTSSRIDWPTANTAQIDAEIVGTNALSSSYVDTLGAQKVGFQAIEYFLFDPVGGDAGAVNRLLGPDNARRRAYLLALATNVRERAEELRDAWEPSGGNFGADFVNSGIGGSAFATLKEAFDEVVNRMIFVAELVEEDRLGAPLGVDGGGPRPDLVESPRSGDTVAGIVADLQGIADVYEGTWEGGQATGIGTQVVALSPDVDTEVRQLLDDAIAAVQAIPTPLADAVVHHRDEVQAAYEAVQALRRALTVDVASVLGVKLTFGGNDGD